jgi:Mn-dependent DtxR family transcriptional regulator
MLRLIDVVPSKDVRLTHEDISHMLGVRRESISSAVGKLHRLDGLENSRGQITVLDLGVLEAQACECHALMRAHSQLPPAAPSLRPSP